MGISRTISLAVLAASIAATPAAYAQNKGGDLLKQLQQFQQSPQSQIPGLPPIPGLPKIPEPKIPQLPQIPQLPSPTGGPKGNIIEQGQLIQTLMSTRLDPSPSASQAQVHKTAAGYGFQGAAIGGISGALAGCLIADAIGYNCGDGAWILGAIGVGAGYIIGENISKRQQAYASKENSLQAKLDTANADLAEATATRKAAETLVQEHSSSLAKLRSDVASKKKSRNDMAREVGYMTKDLEALKVSKEGLGKQLAALNQAIADTPAPADKGKLQAVYNQLQVEERSLDKAMQTLAGVVAEAKV